MTSVPTNPVEDPSSLLSSSVTVTAFPEVFTTAMPVLTDDEASTSSRKAVPASTDGAPASVTVVPSFRNEKMTSAEGAVVLGAGTRRTEPLVVAAPAPNVCIVKADREDTE